MTEPSSTESANALPRLHVITPERLDAAAVTALDASLAAGAPLVQVRTKGGTDRARLATVEDVLARCRAAGASCLVNDRVDLALASGADGVHVGADDLTVATARRLLGPDRIVGGTCRDAEQARRAEAEGATYVGVGPVYASATKSGLPDGMGPAGVAAVAAAVSIPVIAISGVTADRIPELLDAGAHGVAVVAAVFGAADPHAATVACLDSIVSTLGPSTLGPSRLASPVAGGTR